MKDDFISKHKAFFYLAFIIIALITLFPLFFTGFASADDFHYYLVARNGQIMESSAMLAKLAGRFYFYLVMPVYSLPYIVDSMVVVKLFQFIPLIVCFLLFIKIVHTITKTKEISWMFLLVALMTMQISQFTSLFVTYPFYFTFSFAMLLVSFLLLLRYFESRKTWYLVVAALFFALGLLFYETYILFLLFAGLTILFYNRKENHSVWQKLKRSFVQFLPFLVVGVLYIAAYFIFRIYHPSQYSGTNFDAKELTAGNFFSVLWYLSYSSFPLTIYEATKNLFWDKSELVSGYSPVLLNLVMTARVEWIVKGILVSFFGYKLLMTTPSLKTKGFLTGAGVCILLIFVPHIPLALTKKYIFHGASGHMFGYVTTFFSFFGSMLLITLVLSYLVNLLNFSRIIKTGVVSFLVAGFFICSVLTDFSNYSVAKDIRSANLRLYAIDELLKSDEFKAVQVASPFYGKHLWDNPSYTSYGLTEQSFNWMDYFQAKTGKFYPVGREDTIFLAYSKKVPEVPYFMTLRQADKTEDIALVMAKMEPVKQQDSVVSHFAERATVLYYSPYKIFTVSFRVKYDTLNTVGPIRINHIGAEVSRDRMVELTIYNTVKFKPATIFTIQMPGIDLNSIMISNMVNHSNPIFYL